MLPKSLSPTIPLQPQQQQVQAQRTSNAARVLQTTQKLFALQPKK